uniref:XK-related protein n=1 Tax=Periophthalmus magnuspinnatus TaxID=409849 RepID=A0A3B4BEX5_9GOBI
VPLSKTLPHHLRLDFILTIVGLLALVVDIILDIFTAIRFYTDQDYVRLGIFIFFLVASSLLVQAYSWLWYEYDEFKMVTNVEKVPSKKSLKILHFLQLGTYLRHMGVMETAICKYLQLKGVEGMGPDLGDAAVCLSHDVAMLRIVEAFSESLPQLALMVTTNIQKKQQQQALPAIASAFFASMTVMSYHRSLRSFLKDKQKQTFCSSVVYLSWNFLLISARVAALALFSSELPCYICIHFLCSWFVLLICVWCCQTNFMNSKEGEVLYRGTVALIWYFNWFNVVKGNTLWKTILYHGYILADITLLCGLWFWKINSKDLKNFNYLHLLAYVLIFFVYILGLVVKSIYYHCFHPKVTPVQHLWIIRLDLSFENNESLIESHRALILELELFVVTNVGFGQN